jgi:hypothetical protein
MAQGLIDGVLVDLPDLPSSVYIPPQLSRAQFQLSLLHFNLLDSVNAAVAAADIATQIKYNEASYFERSNGSLNAMATALGITQAELDDIFIYGNSIVI